MSARIALGIDLGLSGMRAAVVRADGAVLGTARDSEAVVRGPGRAESDPTRWMERLSEAAAAALARAGLTTVDVVGVGAFGPAPLLIDDRHEPLTPALLFSLDRRSETVRRELMVQTGLGDRELSLDHAVPKLEWWRRTRPDLWERAAFAVDATGFLVGQLVGAPVMDTATACDHRAPGLEALIPKPPAKDPLEIAGEVRRGPHAFPVPDGVPVAVGSYDSYVDLAGIGVTDVGDRAFVLGSTLIGARIEASGAQAPAGLEAVPYVRGTTLVGGWTSSSGSILDWLATLFGEERAAEFAEAALDMPPGSSGVLVVPHFEGRRSPAWDPDARGIIAGLTTSTTPQDLYRACVDALALSARELAGMLAPGSASGSWTVTGGGTGNQAWLQATADAMGSVLTPLAAEGQAVAAALFGLRALGVDPVVPAAPAIQPDPHRHERFARLHDLQQRLSADGTGVVHDLVRQEPV